jgi:hypothetical protein
MIADGDSATSRQPLIEASRDCQALAGTLPRRAWFTILVTIATIGLGIVGPLLPLQNIHVSGRAVSQHAFGAIVAILVFGVAPLVLYFRSLSCKRAIFSPASAAHRPLTAEVTGAQWDLYELERAAFTETGYAAPLEWESRAWIRWLIGIAYGLAFGIPVIYADPVQTVIVVSVIAILAALIGWRGRRKRITRESQPTGPQELPPDLGVQPTRC